jgi:hypothetical protein
MSRAGRGASAGRARRGGDGTLGSAGARQHARHARAARARRRCSTARPPTRTLRRRRARRRRAPRLALRRAQRLLPAELRVASSRRVANPRGRSMTVHARRRRVAADPRTGRRAASRPADGQTEATRGGTHRRRPCRRRRYGSTRTRYRTGTEPGTPREGSLVSAHRPSGSRRTPSAPRARRVPRRAACTHPLRGEARPPPACPAAR